MTQTRLEMFKGDAQAWDLVVKVDDVPTDITDWTFQFAAKAHLSDVTAAFEVDDNGFEISDGPNGEVRFTIPPEATGNVDPSHYFFDIKGKEQNGNPHTLSFGQITVKAVVSLFAA